MIDHAYLTDPEGADLAVLQNGIDLCRRMVASPALASLLGRPLDEFSANPGAGEAAMRASTAHYWHPSAPARSAMIQMRAQSSTPPGWCTAATTFGSSTPRSSP